jgi:hypothetical protein
LRSAATPGIVGMPRRFNGARQVQVPGADVIAKLLEIAILEIAIVEIAIVEIAMVLGAGDPRRRLP